MLTDEHLIQISNRGETLRSSAEVFETRVQRHVKNKQVGELARRRPTPCADADRPFYVGSHSA